MFGWDFDELALLVGGGYLALRVLGGLALVFWRFIADSALAFHMRPWTSLLTSAAVGLVAVGSLSSVVGGGLPPNISAVAYFATFFGGLMLGSTLDLFLTFQFYRLSHCLMALHVPKYREQLLHGEEQVRLGAANRLIALGASARAARPELLALFSDQSTELRAAAVHAVLVGIPDPSDDDAEAPRAARARLTDPSLPVRVFAAAILAAYGARAEEVLPVLCEGLECEDLAAHCMACSALGRLGAAAVPAIPALRARALKGEADLKGEVDLKGALDVLIKMGEPAIPALIEVLDRGDSTDKWMAARALGELGEPARIALPALRKLSIQRMVLASAAAKKAIQKLGGDIR
jgi:hypothetical protein